MVERDPNLRNGLAILIGVASAIGVALALAAYRDHFPWYAYLIVEVLPLGLMATAALELSGWSSAYRVRRISRLIRRSPPGTVHWTRRSGAAYFSLAGVVGLAMLLAWLPLRGRNPGGIAGAIQFAPAVAVCVIAYFILVLASNTYVLSIRARHLTVFYGPLPHPFGKVDVEVGHNWSLQAEARRRRGTPEYALILSVAGPTATRDIDLGIVDSREEAQLLLPRISELISDDLRDHPA